MKTISNKILSIVFICTIALSYACSNDNLKDNEAEPKNSEISFQLLLQGQKKLRSTEPGDKDHGINEDKIKTLDLFLYSGSKLIWHIKPNEIKTSAAKHTIPVKDEFKSYFTDPGTAFNMYFIANADAALFTALNEGVDNLASFKEILVNANGFLSSGQQQQESFLMIGNKTKTLKTSDLDIGTIVLERCAAKIRFRVEGVEIDGYTPKESKSWRAQLVNFAIDAKPLASVAYEPEAKSTLSFYELNGTPLAEFPGATTPFPFYSYPRKWTDKAEQTFIHLIIPLKEDAIPDAPFRDYHYLIPIAKNDADTHLEANKLYDVAVKIIKELGGIPSALVEITGNITIKAWTSEDVKIDIEAAEFLVVSETDFIMSMINTKEITFKSSIADVKLEDGSLKATYTYVPYSLGQPTTKPVAGDQLPTVTIAPNVANGTITINSKLPVNFLPKTIEFIVTNGPLKQKIKIEQKPSIFFNTIYSEKALNSAGNASTELPGGGNKNRYIYIIENLASNNTPDGNNNIIWGFPPLDDDGYVINNNYTAKIVSPKFMMASQMGATLPMTVNNAKQRCKKYWEEVKINGVIKRLENWRLPTRAEVRYIEKLQLDPNNADASGKLLLGRFYWSNNGTVELKNNSTSGGSTSTRGHTRCVRDVIE